MQKITIIGANGAGKTTVAHKLMHILKISEVHHLDSIFWQSSWKRIGRKTRIDLLKELVKKDQWIIEGTYIKSSDSRLQAANTIIFLDIPSLICVQRIIKRHYTAVLRKVEPSTPSCAGEQSMTSEGFKHCGYSRCDMPHGSTDRLTLLRVLKVMIFPLRERKSLIKKLREFSKDKVVWLHSTQEVENFLAQLKRGTLEDSSFVSHPLQESNQEGTGSSMHHVMLL